MAYDASTFTHEEDIQLSEKTKALIEEANTVYKANFDSKVWYGRCIFLSWYCSKATCKFCYRSMPVHVARHSETSKRSMGSVLLEALFCKVFNWRIEFITGGYGMMPFEELVEYLKNISAVYGEKLWVNLGVISPKNIEMAKPYVKGICSSIESPTPALHDYMCPDKPIAPYEAMYEGLDSSFKKSAALIVGLGNNPEKIEDDFTDWVAFIKKHQLDRITVYALKPIRGGIIEKGPEHDEYLAWIARLRIAFPKLEIIGGTNLRRSEETGWMIRAGANAITKFPATKQFGTTKASLLSDLIVKQDREFISNITVLPNIDWEREIDWLDISDKYKEDMKRAFPLYFKNFSQPKDADKKYA